MHTEPLLIVIFLRYLLEPPPDLLDPLLRRVSHDDGTCLSSASTEDLLAGRNGEEQRQHWLQPRHYSFTTSSSLSPSPAKSFVVSENENESKNNNNKEVNVAEQQFESNPSTAKKFNGPATSFAINENTVNV